MKQKYSSAWKSSSQVRKQRKYRFNAPLHIRQDFVSCNLSKELRSKYSKRHVPLRKGDTVLIKKGQFSGKSGKVEQVLLKKGIAYVSGIEVVKKNGSKVKYPLKPCNLQITSLILEDKKRLLQFEKGKTATPKKLKSNSKSGSLKSTKQKVKPTDNNKPKIAKKTAEHTDKNTDNIIDKNSDKNIDKKITQANSEKNTASNKMSKSNTIDSVQKGNQGEK